MKTSILFLNFVFFILVSFNLTVFSFNTLAAEDPAPDAAVTVQANSSRTCQSTLDQDLSGLYIAQVHGDSKLVGSYRIIVKFKKEVERAYSIQAWYPQDGKGKWASEKPFSQQELLNAIFMNINGERKNLTMVYQKNEGQLEFAEPMAYVNNPPISLPLWIEDNGSLIIEELDKSRLEFIPLGKYKQDLRLNILHELDQLLPATIAPPMIMVWDTGELTKNNPHAGNIDAFVLLATDKFKDFKILSEFLRKSDAIKLGLGMPIGTKFLFNSNSQMFNITVSDSAEFQRALQEVLSIIYQNSNEPQVARVLNSEDLVTGQKLTLQINAKSLELLIERALPVIIDLVQE